MNRVTRTVALLLLIFIAGCTCCTGNRVTAKADLHQTLDHQTGSPIDIRTRNGSVSVVADPTLGDQVVIDATIKASGSTLAEAQTRLDGTVLHIDREDGRLVIHPEWPGGAQSNDGCNLRIRLPDAVGVTITSSNGSITIAGLAGTADLTTSNGFVSVDQHDGDVIIVTANGSVGCSTVTGSCDVRSSNGALTLTDITGPVVGRTNNASITLRLPDSAADSFRLKTSNGFITATAPAEFPGLITGSTSNGRVTITGPGEIHSKSRNGFTVKLGEGGQTSSMTTSNASLRLDVVE
ncbi:MAG: hypothetical protein KAS72_05505 [Phycisphaerales bacterium]|nr:hypothetical protein [Phycisphaerales bacterium]